MTSITATTLTHRHAAHPVAVSVARPTPPLAQGQRLARAGLGLVIAGILAVDVYTVLRWPDAEGGRSAATREATATAFDASAADGPAALPFSEAAYEASLAPRVPTTVAAPVAEVTVVAAAAAQHAAAVDAAPAPAVPVAVAIVAPAAPVPVVTPAAPPADSSGSALPLPLPVPVPVPMPSEIVATAPVAGPVLAPVVAEVEEVVVPVVEATVGAATSTLPPL